MRIQHNIAAMNSYRNYSANTKSVSKNLEKLSSGYRINRAGDDAAGLAISEKMRAQITGLKTAQKNAKDGISLVQTAEGALTEVHSMLNRMFELAEQSANGTYDNEVDRANLQKEVSALKTEIDRIADSSNFNGIKLLDGNLKQTVSDVMASSTATNTADGTIPNAATKASVTLELGAGNTTGIAITVGTDTASVFGAKTAGGTALSALFDLKVNGVARAWTENTVALADGDKIELTAKTAGELSSSAMSDLNGITGAASLDVVAGTAEGAGAPATKSAYSLEFDFTKIADGQTFKIGDKTFELSTDNDTTDTGNEKINISGLDLTNATGQLSAAQAIQTAVNTAIGSKLSSNVAGTGDIATNVYTLNLTGTNAGEDGNLGAVRVSEAAANSGAIAGTYTAGKAAGAGTPGSFASATYDFDLSKLEAGDSIQIGSTTISIVEDGAEDLANGKIGLTNAKDGTKLASAFETNGYAASKLSFAAGQLTITGTTVGETGAALTAGNGKVTFTNADGKVNTIGGLTLQIGDTADSFNMLTVSVGDMHAAALGINGIDIGNQSGASAAMSKIKDAINSVSGTRGDLGALQNRLDHTINNLSVMHENIQDAEATIRDVDVAEEMMAYTKNNILVQSAQAMLAQANQLPQGVLQLLG